MDYWGWMIKMVALHADDIPELQQWRGEYIVLHSQYHTDQIKETWILSKYHTQLMHFLQDVCIKSLK